ncbi:MAG: hypothetical protein ACI4J7_13375 [Ruminiclostridium sp.]
MRIAMSERKYKLLKIFESYLFYKDGETYIKEDAPQNAKEAFNEFITIPDEPEDY